MGDSRNEKGYEMAPQNDPEKGGADGEVAQDEWTGLGKEELLRVADTPAWNWARNILLILFWVGWVAMLIAAIIIVVKVPRCPEVEWWEKSVFYQAYPRSLKDSDGDGVGDLKGVDEKLSHLENIGAKVLYLNSIYQERNVTEGGSVDVGYDITDFRNVDEILGSLEDFDNLVANATAKGMKVVLEFVPNHSSDEHPWFAESRLSKDSEYADYYIWADGGGASTPPNDWKNVDDGPAWNWEAGREQWYYAYFGPKQPDFNYNNDTLRQEILDILTFWLDHNVDGFVFSHVDYLVEPPITTVADGVRRRRQADTTGESGVTTSPGAETAPGAEAVGTTPAAEPEPEPIPSKPMPPQYDFLGGNSETQDKLFDLLKEWRKLLNDASYLGKYRLMIAQSEGPLSEVSKLYGINDSYIADLPLNTGFLDTLEAPLSGTKVATSVENWMKAKENVNNEKRWNTWMLGCHDRSRIATRAGADYVNALNFMLLTLPGTPLMYYGEEIGMEDVTVPGDADKRDAFRSPMPWTNATTNAGFTFENATAYLPLPSNAAENNVQMQSMKDFSNLNILSELAALHAEPSLVAGKFTKIVGDANVFAYIREFGEWPKYLVVVNLGSGATHNFYDLAAGMEKKLPMEGKIVLSTSGEERSGKKKKNGMRKGTKESLTDFKTEAGEAVLIRL